MIHRQSSFLQALFFVVAASPVAACDLALVLAVDVSGSVDNEEYRIQMQGIADGLRDAEIGAALVNAESSVMVVQWTGSARQTVTVPWRRVQSLADLYNLAEEIEQAPRRWRNFSTAIGEALVFSADQFSEVAECKQRVIDVSGDGSSNEGVAPQDVHASLARADITVNAIVIEGAELNLTDYFRKYVILGPTSFVITTQSYSDYPDRMKQKLYREVTIPIAEHRSDAR